ncbi:MAG: thiosulfate oxidation carrier complex protein SoxZ [Aeromicrobium sp.]|nr:thiosulfate oxidation carrier complex protein SoxZ [Burkholderiales bacterium]
MARNILTVPTSAKTGDIIELRALIQHPMETGYRRSSEGMMMARELIRSFTCRFLEAGKTGEGELVFTAKLFAAVSANPYLSFHTTAFASGAFLFVWAGDNGFAQSERVAITVR